MLKQAASQNESDKSNPAKIGKVKIDYAAEPAGTLVLAVKDS